MCSGLEQLIAAIPSSPYTMSVRWLLLEVWVPLNPFLVACHTFKRTQASPLCLPEILISEYALVSPHNSNARDLNSRPLHPDGHVGCVHCSPMV